MRAFARRWAISKAKFNRRKGGVSALFYSSLGAMGKNKGGASLCLFLPICRMFACMEFYLSHNDALRLGCFKVGGQVGTGVGEGFRSTQRCFPGRNGHCIL